MSRITKTYETRWPCWTSASMMWTNKFFLYTVKGRWAYVTMIITYVNPRILFVGNCTMFTQLLPILSCLGSNRRLSRPRIVERLGLQWVVLKELHLMQDLVLQSHLFSDESGFNCIIPEWNTICQVWYPPFPKYSCIPHVTHQVAFWHGDEIESHLDFRPHPQHLSVMVSHQRRVLRGLVDHGKDLSSKRVVSGYEIESLNHSNNPPYGHICSVDEPLQSIPFWFLGLTASSTNSSLALSIFVCRERTISVKRVTRPSALSRTWLLRVHQDRFWWQSFTTHPATSSMMSQILCPRRWVNGVTLVKSTCR